MKMSPEEVVDAIIKTNIEINKFWKDGAPGWAPIEATHLLNRSRLDWQVSLSYCLNDFLKIVSNEKKKGYLILGWVNLGSLIEGTLKLFLSVYYKDYKNDIKAIPQKRGKMQEPDELELESLKIFFRDKNILDIQDINWITDIQHKRNAVHAYRDRDIGNHEEFIENLYKYFDFLCDIKGRLPYPDFN